MEPTKRWHTREDSGIRLDRTLRWWHDGEPIEHPKIVEAFNCGLRPRDDGRFELWLGNDWCFVEVEDAAYAVQQVSLTPTAVSLSLSDRTEEELVPETLEVDPEGVLCCSVKGHRAKARFGREAQFVVGEKLEEAPGGWVLRLSAQRALVLPKLRFNGQ